MIHENTYKAVDFSGAKGLIFLGKDILVYRRDTRTNKFPGCLNMIGGGREGNETPFETFSREAREEVGLTITKNDIHFSCSFPSFDDHGMISFFFVTKPLSFVKKDIEFGSEGSEWLMMTPEEFIDRPDGIERQQKRVRDYLEGRLGHE